MRIYICHQEILTNVLVVEARFADPVSLVHFPKVIATTEALKQLEEMFA